MCSSSERGSQETRELISWYQQGVDFTEVSFIKLIIKRVICYIYTYIHDLTHANMWYGNGTRHTKYRYSRTRHACWAAGPGHLPPSPCRTVGALMLWASDSQPSPVHCVDWSYLWSSSLGVVESLCPLPSVLSATAPVHQDYQLLTSWNELWMSAVMLHVNNCFVKWCQVAVGWAVNHPMWS